MDKLKACLFHFRTTFRTYVIVMSFATGHTIVVHITAPIFVGRIISVKVQAFLIQIYSFFSFLYTKIAIGKRLA